MEINLVKVLSLVLFANLVVADLNVRPCHQKDPQINACLKDSFTSLYKYVKDVKQEPVLNAIDHIKLKKVPINLETLNVKGNFEDMSIYGGSKFQITAVKSDLSKLRIDLKLLISRVDAKGTYKLAGTLPVLPINAAGNFHAILNGVSLIVKLYIKRVPNFKDNETYLQLDNIALDYAVKDVRFKINEQASKILEEVYTQLINDNAQLFLKEIKPSLASAFRDTFRDIFQTIMSTIPEKVILIQ